LLLLLLLLLPRNLSKETFFCFVVVFDFRLHPVLLTVAGSPAANEMILCILTAALKIRGRAYLFSVWQKKENFLQQETTSMKQYKTLRH